MNQRLTIETLDPATFEPFGEVLDIADAELLMINEGTTERYHALARTQVDPAGTVIINLFRGQPRQFPYQVHMMERHPLGSQAFYPLDGRPWLVIVAPDENGRPGVPRAFRALGHQGVNYRANVWHHPLMALGETSDFLVVDRDGEGINLEEYSYPVPYSIETPGEPKGE